MSFHDPGILLYSYYIVFKLLLKIIQNYCQNPFIKLK